MRFRLTQTHNLDAYLACARGDVGIVAEHTKIPRVYADSNVLNLPALLPPLGIVSNYENPKNLKASGLVAAHVFVAALAVCLRFYVKTYAVKKTLIEDCKHLISLKCVC